MCMPQWAKTNRKQSLFLYVFHKWTRRAKLTYFIWSLFEWSASIPFFYFCIYRPPRLSPFAFHFFPSCRKSIVHYLIYHIYCFFCPAKNLHTYTLTLSDRQTNWLTDMSILYTNTLTHTSSPLEWNVIYFILIVLDRLGQ